MKRSVRNRVAMDRTTLFSRFRPGAALRHSSAVVSISSMIERPGQQTPQACGTELKIASRSATVMAAMSGPPVQHRRELQVRRFRIAAAKLNQVTKKRY